MTDGKLIQILKTFTVSEMGRFRDFVKSPYHNKNKNVMALAQFLEQQYPDFKPHKTTKEKAFAYSHSGKKYNDLRLRQLMSVILKLSEDFLVSEKMRKNSISSSVKLMESYRERTLEKQFLAAQRKTLETQLLRKKDLFYYYHQYRIELAEEQFQEQQKGRRKTTNLQNVSDHLDAFYIINKLKQSCAIFSYQNVFKQEYRLRMVDEIMQHLKKNTYDVPLIHLYYSGLLTLTENENTAHFFRLKSDLKKYNDSIPREEAVDIHVIARNYCIKKLNTGDTQFIRELFELYKLGLDDKAVLDDKGEIPAAAFKNIVAVGLKLKEFSWTEGFIRDYSALLKEQVQKDYLNYNLAKVYFEKKEYTRVIEMLRDVEYTDIFIAVDARTLLIKTYFELDEFDVLDSQLDSFKQFVSRKKELAYHSKNYLNTIRFTKSIMRLRPGAKREAAKLKSRIENEQMLTEKSWLMDKLGEV